MMRLRQSTHVAKLSYQDLDDFALSTMVSRKQANDPMPLKELLKKLKRLGLLPIDKDDYSSPESVFVYDTLLYPAGTNKAHDIIH